MPKKAKSKAQARFFGFVAGGGKPKRGGEGLSASKAGEMLRGTKMRDLPARKSEADGEREDPIDDEIEGGVGDEADPADFDNDQVLMGIQIELEHTNDIIKALEITLDHLTEDPEYYTKLTAMERGACDDEVDVPKLEKVYKFSTEPDEDYGDDPFDTGQMKVPMRFGHGHSGGVGGPSR